MRMYNLLDMMLIRGQGVAQQEFLAEEKSNNERIMLNWTRKPKSNYDGEQDVIEAELGIVQEGTLEKSSLCSAALETRSAHHMKNNHHYVYSLSSALLTGRRW